METLSPTIGDLREIEELGPWFHNLHLPDGRQTAPGHWLGDFPRGKWNRIRTLVPEDLTGWTALDIGCNAGFYSIELARRGAQVTGVDIDPRYLRQAEWAVAQFGLEDRITLRQASVYELAREEQPYDLVWFMGVLYHLRHPLLALDIVRQLTGRLLMFQTLTAPGNDVATPPADFTLAERSVLRKPGWPMMAFIEGRLEGDPTNWWAPNHACVEALLRSSGFRVLHRPAHEVYVCQPEPHEDAILKSLREQELAMVLSAGPEPVPRSTRLDHVNVPAT